MAKSSKAGAATKVRSSRASFEEVVERAIATSAELPTALIDSVRKKFDELEEEIAGVDEQAMTKDGETRMNALADRADELERLRAYVVPKAEIVVEGNSRLSDMTCWSVPQAVIDQLNREVMPQLRCVNVLEARGALRSLYETYDYWDWWVEEHARSMRLAASVMLIVLLGFLTGAVFLLHYGHVYSGVFCAGASGALLSVLAKLPPVLSFGSANAYFYRIVGRIAVGIAASMIGMGLLASDLISLQLSDHLTIAKMLDGKDLLCGTIDTTAAGANAAARPATCTPDDQRLSRRAVLLLLAIAMLFGFSERALSTFEDRVLPQSTTVVQTGPVPPSRPAESGPPTTSSRGDMSGNGGASAQSPAAQPADAASDRPSVLGKDTG